MRKAFGSWLLVALGSIGCSGDHPHSDAALTAGQSAPAPATGAAGTTPPASTGGAGAASVPTGQTGPRAGTSAGSGVAGVAGVAGASGAAATGPDAAGAGASSSAAGAGGAAGSGASAGQGAAGQPAEPVPTGKGPAETKAIGYGKAATGGGNAPAMRVDTLAAMQAAVDAYSGSGGLVLEYTGKFDFGSIPDPCTQHTRDAQKLEIKEKNDITIRGADGSAANFGIHIASTSSNIIIRNMKIGLTPGGGDSDMISLEGMSKGSPRDIWIDHNELFSSLAECPGAGDTAFDGMIDIKKGADNVTVSYNYLHDHHKACLNGYSDDDELPRHVTFHHNLFENVGSRTPLQRHGFAHIFNNVFDRITTSGINVRMKGYALVEANYFENVKNPVTSRDSPEVGYWELRANNLATKADVSPGNGFNIRWDDGNEGTLNALDWTTTAMFPQPIGYDYAADSFACVRAGLKAVAGAGKSLATLTCR
jgi:pectate lyase